MDDTYGYTLGTCVKATASVSYGTFGPPNLSQRAQIFARTAAGTS